MIRHLLATDVRRFRWTLAAWVGLVAAYASLISIHPDTIDNKAQFDALSTALLLLFFAVHLAPLVIVPMIVQADAAVGSEVFWWTHPIPPRALLAAKAILLGVAIVMLPASLELAAMLIAHVPPSEIARIAADTLLSSTVWLALLLVGSAVTPSYPKFALLGVSVVVGLAACIVIWQTIVLIGARNSSTMVSIGVGVAPETSDFTSFVVFLAGLIGACCAVLVLQYQRRQRLVSVPAGAGTVVAAFLAATWWPWPLIQKPVPLPDWTAGVRVRAVSAGATFDSPTSWMRPDNPRTVWLPMRIDSLPPAWYASIRLDDGRYTLPDGIVIRTLVRGMSNLLPFEGTNEPPQRVAVRQLLSVNRLGGSEPQMENSVVAIVASASDSRRMEGATAEYHGSFTVSFSRVEIAGVIPLRSGARFDGGVYQLTLRDMVDAGSNSVTFNGIETRATSLFDSHAADSYSLYAVNHARSEAIAASSFAWSQLDNVAGYGVHVGGGGQGFLRHGVGVSIVAANTSLPESIALDEDWLKNAQLVVVRTRQMGHIVRAVDLSGVRVLREPPKIK
ncbi:MAG TPA: hypothetical protein VH138_10040 [Vicinamibacterales bacterium]|nr:hypothetical protein [Vicinamibacterales bacterium]